MFNGILNAGFIACSALLVVNSIQLWLGRQRILRQLQELEDLRQGELVRQQRIIDLSRMNASRQFEVRWLTGTVPGSNQLERLFALLEEYHSTKSPFYAWMFDANGALLARNAAARGLPDVPELTHVQGVPVSQAVSSGRSVFPRDFHWAGGAEWANLTELHLLTCGPRESAKTFLALSSVPDFTGHEELDRKLLADLCEKLVVQSTEEPDDVATSADELDLVRDMLTLRTVTDHDFESPGVMLQEFLTRLAYLTDFERASLFRMPDNTGPSPELLATGGVSVTSQQDHLWRLQEQQLIHSQGPVATTAAWIAETPASSDSVEPRPATILIVEDPTPGRPRTLLILSSRSPVTRHRIKEELADWSVQYLPQAFEKALVRVQNEERARRDGLTRLANRQTFDTELQKCVKAGLVHQSPCSLLLIDIDHFKSINDTHGHLTGDAVLRGVARTISLAVQQTRVTDRSLVARFGGEEFAVILPEISLAGASRIAEQIRLAIELDSQVVESESLPLTASIGVASCPAQGTTPLALIAAADRALYTAKQSGRNRVCQAEGSKQRVPAMSN